MTVFLEIGTAIVKLKERLGWGGVGCCNESRTCMGGVSGVERIDTLCSKNEHSLNSTKTVKNFCLLQ